MRIRFLIAAAGLALPCIAEGQTCTHAGWVYPFGEGVSYAGSNPYASAHINDVVLFDPDGAGPQPPWLVVAGLFDRAGGKDAYNVAAWDGLAWRPMSLSQAYQVLSVASVGGVLYAGVQVADIQPALLMRWNGALWETVQLIGNSCEAMILRAFDPDGAGPLPESLMIGYCPWSSTATSTQLYRWDGAALNPVGVFQSKLLDMKVVPLPDGTNALYLCGAQQWMGGDGNYGISRWDGQMLTPLVWNFCYWFQLCFQQVNTIGYLQIPGGSTSLFAGGSFYSFEGTTAHAVARWDGQAWQAAENGLASGGALTIMATIDPGGLGPQSSRLAAVIGSTIQAYDGQTWSPAFASFDAGPNALIQAGDSLVAAGAFSVAGNNYATHIARTLGPIDVAGTNTIWAPVGQTLTNSVHALAGLPAASGSLAPGLYAGGSFYTAGSAIASGIARWDGVSWSRLGQGANGEVDALSSATIGSATALYAGGEFTTMAAASAPHIASWNGSGWSTLGAGLNDRVESLVPLSGTVIAGGAFTASGATQLSHIARWNGTSWSALASGTDGDVQALTTFNDGTGEALYAAGSFLHAGGVTAPHISRWNGSSWSAVGCGFDGNVLSLAVYDDGSGPALYAGGFFRFSCSTNVSYIAKWNGAAWVPVGSGLDGEVDTLTVFDPDGQGPARPGLLAGGRFLNAGGTPAKYAALWDGMAWTPLGIDDGAVLAAAVLDIDGAGPGLPSLFLGGDFTTVGGSSSPHIAQYLACATCYANCDASTTPPVLNINDFQCFINRFAAGDSYANCDGSSVPPLLNVNDFQCFLNAFATGCY